MRPPTPLEKVNEVAKEECCRVLEVVVTGALRDGHWLLVETDDLLYVADDLEREARELWPHAEYTEPKLIRDGTDHRDLPATV